MASAVPKVDLTRRYSYEEWYQLIQTSETKYEFVDGWLIDVRAMAGGTVEHADIAVNILTSLRMALKDKPCRPRNSDLAVRARTKARYRYPDVSVFCAPPEFEPDDTKRFVALNPRVIFEVLSPSTEGEDRGDKFGDYRAIETLAQYVLVSSDKPLIECYTRRDDGTWLFQYWTGLDATARLASIQTDLPLRDVYGGVEFPPDPDELPPAAPPPTT